MSYTRILSGLCILSLAASGMSNSSSNLFGQGDARPGNATVNTAPKNNNQQPQEVSPQLERILVDWANRSAGIKKLQGKHRRWVYDKVFNVEKRAEGKFYYESPDKGRIDLEAVKVDESEVSRRKDPKTGQSYTIKGDHPERWICNGLQIWQINDAEKTVEKIDIPEQARGRNIMDGPLPFLFGMPPEKAKRRYWLKLTRENDAEVWLEVKPRWKQDAAQYREANVILSKKTYLPTAVQLIDPAGNSETVFTFHDMEANAIPILFWINPFQPRLPGYKEVVKRTQLPQATPHGNGPLRPQPRLVNTADEVVVPTCLNMPWKDAQALLEKANLKPKFLRGRKTADKRLQYVVYQQQPQPNTRVKKGAVVEITLYDKATSAASDNP